MGGRGEGSIRYTSPDTAPAGYSVVRSPWTAPALLLTFALTSALLVPILPSITRLYAGGLESLTRSDLPAEGSLALRPFLAILVCAFALFAAGRARQRLTLLVFSVFLFAASVLLVDVGLATLHSHGGPSPLSEAGAFITGVVGALVLIVGIFTRYHLPSSIRVTARLSRPTAALILGGLGLGMAITAAVVLTKLVSRLLRDVAAVPLLGGAGSEVVQVVLLVTLVLFWYAGYQRRRAKPADGPTLSVAFVVPAHNEEAAIEKCIESLDVAAGNYPGPCSVFIVENGSVDRTAEVADRALARCVHLRGKVLRSRKRGKAAALNHGSRHSSADVVVRVDADSLVEPFVLQKLVPYFWNPRVGGVAGLPLPRNSRSWIGRMRTMEVYYNVAVKRCVQNALDAVMVLPGFMVAYRRELLLGLGGYAKGVNGEDADMTVRMGRLGYRIISDPTIHAFTEVPESLAHLREQRMRWARGMFHMAARNRSTITMRQGPRGLLLLPWALWSAARKAMLMPALACLAVVSVIDPSALSLAELAAIGTLVVAVQVLVMMAILIAFRQWAALFFAPTYLLFRLMLIYFCLESFLSLPLRSRSPANGTGASLGRLWPIRWSWRSSQVDRLVPESATVRTVASGGSYSMCGSGGMPLGGTAERSPAELPGSARAPPPDRAEGHLVGIGIDEGTVERQ